MVSGVGQFNYASHIWLGQTLVAMATKICDFQHKIGFNLACAADTSRCLLLLGDFRDLSILCYFAQTTPVAMVTKNWEIYQKICHNLGCV